MTAFDVYIIFYSQKRYLLLEFASYLKAQKDLENTSTSVSLLFL